MKTKYLFVVIIALIASANLTAQALFGVQIPKTNEEQEQQCKTCREAFKAKPREVMFGITKEGTELYLQTNDAKWFDQLFKTPKDGLLLDIVSKERYDCALEKVDAPAFGIYGEPQEPIFSKAIKKGLKKTPDGRYRTKVGTVPAELQGQELEFNIYFISNNYLCRYNRVYDLKVYKLALLDMGMYLDFLTYEKDIKNATDTEEGFRLKYKTLKFKVPFEKNKSEYSAEDIKPVYDSLQLTDYDIKKIKIEAYSSVEGSLVRNVELQEKRANSIASALQKFQKPTIDTEITATENWVEFLTAIQNTPYATFADLDKKSIKAKLTDPTINSALEPYLSKHRKALITLELQKKDAYKNMTGAQLIAEYKKNVDQKNMEEANRLQNAIFERIKGNEMSPDLIDELRVPEQEIYASLLNKNTSLKYLIDEREVLRTYTELLRLDKLLPKNRKIKYNIIATKFKRWWYEVEPVNAEAFRKEILALKNVGVSQMLIDRMLINYHIIKSEKHMRKAAYAEKDKSMKYIHTTYKKVSLSDRDYLNLAQYFAAYSNIEYSLELLKDKVNSIDTEEDLLFYYLNLTLVDENLTQEPEYRAMMLNAIAKNQSRFCELFGTYGEGGVTFQLLENPYLRKTYCENCQQ